MNDLNSLIKGVFTNIKAAGAIAYERKCTVALYTVVERKTRFAKATEKCTASQSFLLERTGVSHARP